MSILRNIKFIIINLSIFFFIQVLYAREYASEHASECVSEQAKINYSTGGNKKFQLQPVKKNIDYKIRLKGSSKYKNLWFQISRISPKSRVIKKRDIKLILNKESKFDYYYYLKDKSGKYKVTVFGNNYLSERYTGLCNFTVLSHADPPKKLSELNINDKVLKYVDKVMGKKVGRGECWDLAQEILDYYSADWIRTLEFGVRLDPEKDKILPGDIVQMRSVKLQYGRTTEYFGRPKHTAIIYKVIAKGDYILAHQNVAGKRYVLKGKFNLNHMKSGTIKFFRPIAGLIKAE